MRTAARIALVVGALALAPSALGAPEPWEAATQAASAYWTILTLSRAAACETCPAIAVARSCASPPSMSACSG